MPNLDWFHTESPRRRILREIVKRLENEEIEQFAQYDGTCPKCFCPYYGILDEGKLRQPLPRILGGKGFEDFYFNRSHGRHVAIEHLYDAPTVNQFSDYEICQSIVMTGLFTREQLGLSKLTNHELEVCERRFAEVRPRRCDCDFGSPKFSETTHFLESDPVLVGGLTAVEQSFVTGKPVRTGYRRRSREAKLRRRRLYRARHRAATHSGGFPITCTPRATVASSLPSPSTGKITLNFKFRPYGVKSRTYRATARFICQKRTEIKVKKLYKQRSYFVKPTLVLPRVQVQLPKPEHKKYWYFLRTRGYYTHSIHHPYGDELDQKAQVVLSDFPT
jgi:hypothetical protein